MFSTQKQILCTNYYMEQLAFQRQAKATNPKRTGSIRPHLITIRLTEEGYTCKVRLCKQGDHSSPQVAPTTSQQRSISKGSLPTNFNSWTRTEKVINTPQAKGNTSTQITMLYLPHSLPRISQRPSSYMYVCRGLTSYEMYTSGWLEVLLRLIAFWMRDRRDINNIYCSIEQQSCA